MSTKVVPLLLVLLLVHPALTHAEDFLGAPVVADAEPVSKTDTRLEYETHLSHDETLSFYQAALQDLPDIKIRYWKDATYIEDDGKLPWHSVTISKAGEGQTTVVIMKDNWTWIMGTLVLRYVGVFVVLLMLFLGMSLSGFVITRFVARTAGEKPSGAK
jgi:hypothetical protein